MLGGYPRRSTESRITSSTRCWRGVRPVSSAGPSGKSVTGASVPDPLEGGPAESDGDMPLLRQSSIGCPTVALFLRAFKHLFERVALLSVGWGTTSYRRSIRTLVREGVTGSTRELLPRRSS